MAALTNRTLRPFRDYDEKDVMNFAALCGVDLPVHKGTLVKLAVGLKVDQDPLEMLGSYGTFTVANTVLQRYGVTPKIVVTQTGETPIGMTLYDCREVDENDRPLKYDKHKLDEMEALLSGQAVPFVTRGIFQVSGAGVTGTAVSAGASAYAGANGLITASIEAANVKIGKFLGPTGSDGSAVLWLQIPL
jgi:hypothetical protein